MPNAWGAVASKDGLGKRCDAAHHLDRSKPLVFAVVHASVVIGP
jgi:hypothetical protein